MTLSGGHLAVRTESVLEKILFVISTGALHQQGAVLVALRYICMSGIMLMLHGGIHVMPRPTWQMIQSLSSTQRGTKWPGRLATHLASKP